MERVDKIQHPSLIKKTFNLLEIDRYLLNILKYVSLSSRDYLIRKTPGQIHGKDVHYYHCCLTLFWPMQLDKRKQVEV